MGTRSFLRAGVPLHRVGVPVKMMSDLDQWWNAPQEAKALTEDNLRQALEQWLAGPTRPEPRYLQDEEGRWMIVSGPHPPPKQQQRERDKSGGTGLPGESVGGE